MRRSLPQLLALTLVALLYGCLGDDNSTGEPDVADTQRDTVPSSTTPIPEIAVSPRLDCPIADSPLSLDAFLAHADGFVVGEVVDVAFVVDRSLRSSDSSIAELASDCEGTLYPAVDLQIRPLDATGSDRTIRIGAPLMNYWNSRPAPILSTEPPSWSAEPRFEPGQLLAVAYWTGEDDLPDMVFAYSHGLTGIFQVDDGVAHQQHAAFAEHCNLVDSATQSRTDGELIQILEEHVGTHDGRGPGWPTLSEQRLFMASPLCNIGEPDDGERACTTDDDCPESGDFCVPDGDGPPGVCGALCDLSPTTDCGSRATCVLIPYTAGDPIAACVPNRVCYDTDGDGFGIGPGCEGADCDEEDGSNHERAAEVCDSEDNDCDGTTDEQCQ